jgi:predicted P-loop ATPase
MEFQYDDKIDIATATTRTSLNWKNKQILWSEFVKKVSTTHRTAETVAEYAAAKKARQDEIKDIGGFVGAYLSGGRRKHGSVAHRQLVTLDIDFGAADFWTDVTLSFHNAALLYSTHKHTPTSPRYRLVLPLDRPVFADEYQAIARRIAGMLDIEAFDPTTFQVERLMYWPSSSKDGEYVFEVQDGPWLEADKILASYHDWTDSSLWPVSEKIDKIMLRSIAKQGDPLEKPGVIGAFCRSYSIAEAIDSFLPEIYEPCEVEGRFSYLRGSTAAGLVVYDDKYAYSHHGTDPISGKLCNAFDLVRIHLFGLRDEQSAEGCPINKLPSFVEMVDNLCLKDPKVKLLVMGEKIDKAKADFAEMGVFQDDVLELEGQEVENEQQEDDSWYALLEVDRKLNPLSTINNVCIILENDHKLKGLFVTDVFRRKKLLTRNAPWRAVNAESMYFTDDDEANIRKYMEQYGISHNGKIKDALVSHFAKHSFHPVRDYLNALSWDGVPRIEPLLIDFLGAKDDVYVRTVTKKSIVAAVTRIFVPGAKFDEVLVLVGKQGVGKSTLLKKLGCDWFSDSFNFHMLQTKEAFEQIQGVWLVEIGELSGLKKADIEGAKSFISKQEDSFRAAYAQNVTTLKRQCVFFGTTNNKDFLRDPTGDRRFWPVDLNEELSTKSVFKDLSKQMIDLIWAEAMVLFKQKEPLHLNEEVKLMALQAQREHSEHDEREGLIQRYLDTLLPENWEEMDTWQRQSFLQGDELQAVGKVRRNRVCVAEIWCELFKGTRKDMTSQNTKILHDIMRKMDGWEQGKSRSVFKKYGNQRIYFRVQI